MEIPYTYPRVHIFFETFFSSMYFVFWLRVNAYIYTKYHIPGMVYGMPASPVAW